MSCALSMFVKALNVQEERSKTTCPFHNVFSILCTSSCTTLVALHPFLPPKWFAGSSWCLSA